MGLFGWPLNLFLTNTHDFILAILLKTCKGENPVFTCLGRFYSLIVCLIIRFYIFSSLRYSAGSKFKALKIMTSTITDIIPLQQV